MAIEGNEMISVSRYIPILINSYPTPINQTKLAALADVSPAAVSQAKDVLQKICNLKSLAYERKLVLKHDEKVWNRLIYYYFANESLDNFISFLESGYFVDGLSEPNLFSYLSVKIGDTFVNVFDEDDLFFIINLVKEKVVYTYKKEGRDIKVKIGELELDADSTQTSNVPYNVNYVVTSLLDSDYSFISDEQRTAFSELRIKLVRFIMLNSKLIYDFLDKIESWLEITEHESAQLKESCDFLSKRVTTKVIFMLSRHVLGETPTAYDLSKGFDV